MSATSIGTHHLFAERGVSSERGYRQFVQLGLKRRKLTERPQREPLRIGLDSGVWLAWCPCGSGVAVRPEWEFAGCINCGRTWTDLRFPEPDLLERIARVLSLRPAGRINKSAVRFYSWRPDETVDDLVRQNIRRGWPIPEGA